MKLTKQNIDILRDFFSTLNRPSSVGANAKILEQTFTPPFKGSQPNKISYEYPKQLSGLHNPEDRQSNFGVTGNTSGGQPFGGESASYGA
jgi:hypothetical protein